MAAPSTNSIDIKTIISGAGLALSLLGSYGAYRVQAATVDEHGERLKKLEAKAEDSAKASADLDKRQTVAEAQMVQILAGLARVEAKLDDLTQTRKEK